jgi:hypothetical protein
VVAKQVATPKLPIVEPLFVKNAAPEQKLETLFI